ncbi:hypothetical protein C5167_000594 [Papaver somniferum]|uniref:Uncharacterized protein n=1 Tax=Papaver somniferum TaxID=3469 RepID=A0A4Y7KT03_PAPSO|nr:hypothetical protein C5167_000594 [Papaver somniferum]
MGASFHGKYGKLAIEESEIGFKCVVPPSNGYININVACAFKSGKSMACKIQDVEGGLILLAVSHAVAVPCPFPPLIPPLAKEVYGPSIASNFKSNWCQGGSKEITYMPRMTHANSVQLRTVLFKTRCFVGFGQSVALDRWDKESSREVSLISSFHVSNTYICSPTLRRGAYTENVIKNLTKHILGMEGDNVTYLIDPNVELLRYPAAGGDRFGGCDRCVAADRYPQNGHSKDRAYDRDAAPRTGGGAAGADSDRYGNGGPTR